jgi:L-alanine-DL-glutamate epimerase-like enolase superfamily enzyme
MTATLRIGQFESTMRFRFKHASAERVATESIIVEIGENGIYGYGEGCPRDYVTGETLQTAESFLLRHGREIAEAANDLCTLRSWINSHEALIDANPAAFCSVELAALDLLGKRMNEPLERVIGVPVLSRLATYSAVIGNNTPIKSWAIEAAHLLWGFSDFKIKLSGHLVRDRKIIKGLTKNTRLRIDANNYWRSAPDCIAYIQQLGRTIWALEEPVEPGDVSAMLEIGEALNTKIILDESFVHRNQLPIYSAQPEQWITNIRVSKCGGVLRSMRLAEECQNSGLDIILGAHVGETSLLTRAALSMGQALQHPPRAREGAYGKILLRSDLTSVPLQFQYGGRLSPARYKLASKPGLGIDVLPQKICWLHTLKCKR